MEVGGDSPPHRDQFSNRGKSELTNTNGVVRSDNAEVKIDNGKEGNERKTESNKDDASAFLPDESPELDGEENDPDYLCGWFGVTSSCLKPFRSPKWALALLCLSSTMQGFIINGLLNVVISTIEKRFHLSSKESGMIRATNSVAQMICTFPVSYFGGKGNKPKYLGLGVMCIGVGAFIFCLPHFITEPYRPSDTSDSSSLCVDDLGLLDPANHDNNSSVSLARGADAEFLNSLKFFFFLGQVFHGVGSCPLWTLGVTYLDENLPTKTSSLYVGIFYAFAVLGPALGYLGGGGLLEIFTDFYSADPRKLNGLNSKHPNWVGLWWIGFLIASFVSLTVGFILFAFPKKLPGWEKVQALRVNESVSSGKTEKTKISRAESKEDGATLSNLFRPVFKDIGLLLRNSPFMCLTLNQASEGFLLAVFSAFMPKFLESQFGAKASDAAFFVGIIVVLCGTTGMIFGGWIIKRFNMSCYTILILILATTFFQLPQMFAFLFMSCDRPPFAAIDYPPSIAEKVRALEGPPMLNQECNVNCSCAGTAFNPICGSNNVIYFSPCHAGCRADVTEPDGKVSLKECSCIQKEATSNDTVDPYGTAKSGNCDPETSCKNWKMYPFLVIFALLLLPMISMTTPTMQATLRTVPVEVKSVALGIQLLLSRLLGAVPGPPIFGGLLDSACLLSQGDSSEGGGACVIYDQPFLSLSMFLVGLVWKIFSLVFIIAAWFFYRSHMRSRGLDPHETLPSPNAQAKPAPIQEEVEVELVSSL